MGWGQQICEKLKGLGLGKLGVGLLVTFAAALGISLTLAPATAFAEIPITIIQTADIHSHFTNRDSVFNLGGLARVATKIQQIKEQNPNNLLLDAGDFTEGSIFFTLNSGESIHHIMEAIGYDAIVLGNHDWLIGPNELYKSLENSQFKIPILSSNLDFTNLDPKINLQKYIKPYVIKEIQGVKVGILGLSTFQFVFDSFFLPVKLVDPLRVAQKYIDEMRKQQGANIVIILSHLGYTTDRTMAQKLTGVDLIVGGHSHVLLKTPSIINNVPITHVGKWGHYVGQIDLSYSLGKTTLKNYQVYQINPDIEEEPAIKSIVDGTIAKLEKKMGPIFHDNIFTSEADLALKDYKNENLLGHWIADAYRALTHTEVAFENPSYASRDIFKGVSTSADIFNMFPQGFNPATGKAWTVKSFKISGLAIKLLVTGVYRSGLYLKMSNAKLVLDLSKTINQVYSLEVNGKPIDNQKMYSLSGTNGITEAIDFLKTYGIDIPISDATDTGKEAWQAVADYLHSKSPITLDKLKWEGRVRTLQPDLVIRPEEIRTSPMDKDHVKVSFDVLNAGLSMAQNATLFVKRAVNPQDVLSDRPVDVLPRHHLLESQPGQVQHFDIVWDVTGLKSGRYATTFFLTPADGEMATDNNILDTYLEIP